MKIYNKNNKQPKYISIITVTLLLTGITITAGQIPSTTDNPKKGDLEVKIIFEEAIKGEKKLNNIIEFNVKWEDEPTGKVGKQELSEDDIPI